MGCELQVCAECGGALIHRDNRGARESSSALGQLLADTGPSDLSITDLDIVSRKGLRDGSQLLRLVEQKQPGHRFGSPQQQTLRLLDDVLRHAATCPTGAGLRLHEKSGVFVLLGDIGGRFDCPEFQGAQSLRPLRGGLPHPIDEPEQFFRWLDPESDRRRNLRRAAA